MPGSFAENMKNTTLVLLPPKKHLSHQDENRNCDNFREKKTKNKSAFLCTQSGSRKSVRIMPSINDNDLTNIQPIQKII